MCVCVCVPACLRAGHTSQYVVLVVLVGLRPHLDEAGEALGHHKLMDQVLVILVQQKKERKKERRTE